MLRFEEGSPDLPSALWLLTKSVQSELKTWAWIEYALDEIIWASPHFSLCWIKVASRSARKGKRVNSIPTFASTCVARDFSALLSIRFICRCLVTLVLLPLSFCLLGLLSIRFFKV